MKRNEEVVDDGYGKGRAAPMPTLARARRYCGRLEIHGSWTAIRISSPSLFARARRQRSWREWMDRDSVQERRWEGVTSHFEDPRILSLLDFDNFALYRNGTERKGFFRKELV